MGGSELAKKLTGLTDSEMRELPVRPVASRKEVVIPAGTVGRGNVRINAEMLVGIEDLNPLRNRLRRMRPRCLRIRKWRLSLSFRTRKAVNK